MASITLEPNTKSVKKPVPAGDRVRYEHLYYAGTVQVRIFDDSNQAGISLELFDRAVKRIGESTILNDEFETTDKNGNRSVVPARKFTYHGKGEFEVINAATGSKKYYIAEETVQAFQKVVRETLDNLSEYQKRFSRNGSRQEAEAEIASN